MNGAAPPVCLGVIGGSGIYEIDWLAHPRWEQVVGPFGKPSDHLLFGDLEGTPLVFLPRHGRGHRIPPTEVNFRANIDALKRAGVTDVISLSAVGSLREDLPPGTFVVVDQFIDRTVARAASFFGAGLVAHVSMATPVCARLGDAIEAAVRETGAPRARGGAYAVAMVTDYDCWHPEHGAVTVDQVMAVMAKNVAAARETVRRSALRLRDRPERCPHGCDRALDGAIM